MSKTRWFPATPRMWNSHAARGWPGFWGMEGPEYLAWLNEGSENEHTSLMGATTYRLMSGFAAEMPDDPGFDTLTAMPKVVFSSTLKGATVVGQHRVGRRGRRRGRAGYEAA